jgi:hypothetical protein
VRSGLHQSPPNQAELRLICEKLFVGVGSKYSDAFSVSHCTSVSYEVFSGL